MRAAVEEFGTFFVINNNALPLILFLVHYLRPVGERCLFMARSHLPPSVLDDERISHACVGFRAQQFRHALDKFMFEDVF